MEHRCRYITSLFRSFGGGTCSPLPPGICAPACVFPLRHVRVCFDLHLSCDNDRLQNTKSYKVCIELLRGHSSKKLKKHLVTLYRSRGGCRSVWFKSSLAYFVEIQHQSCVVTGRGQIEEMVFIIFSKGDICGFQVNNCIKTEKQQILT